MVDPTELHWRKSSYSMGNGGNCVEVADAGHAVYVRDSKNPDGPAFGFGREPWHAFLTALGDGGDRALTRPVAPPTAGRTRTAAPRLLLKWQDASSGAATPRPCPRHAPDRHGEVVPPGRSYGLAAQVGVREVAHAAPHF